MSKDELKKAICFDYSHNNLLTIESPSFTDFTQFLFGSSFQLGKIQAGFSGIDKLGKYQMIVLGGPRESHYSRLEINVLVEFVKMGGSLLIIHDEGGDYGANTNLSELTTHFGFQFCNDIVFDSMNFNGKQTRIIIKDFEAHPTTRNVDGIVQSSACSIKLNKLIEADENINLVPLATSSINAYRTQWDGEDWVKEVDAPRSIVACCSHFYKGRVIALCTVSMFSSLSSAYGYSALSNQEFLTDIFTWLLEPPESIKGLSRDEKMINIPVNYNLFLWMEKLVQDKTWQNIGDIINFSVKFLKDDYMNIMLMGQDRKKRLKSKRKKQIIELQNINDDKERQRQTKLLKNESNILKLGGYEVDAEKELQDIMASLRDITGGEVGNDFTSGNLKTQTPPAQDSERKQTVHQEGPSKPALHEGISPPLNDSPQKIIPKADVVPQMGSLKARADAALDAALKSLDSFDEFSKKLDAFKTLKDDDEPVK